MCVEVTAPEGSGTAWCVVISRKLPLHNKTTCGMRCRSKNAPKEDSAEDYVSSMLAAG
jgi:hypothetical protein